MFSGIVVATSPVIEISSGQSSITLQTQRPNEFKQLAVGDSVAVNGVCLTVESFTESSMNFTIGYETLKVTGWTVESLRDQVLNLEPSLKFGDQIHGHLVSGHVDAMGSIEEKTEQGDCLVLKVKVPKSLSPFIWPKGSLTINGVSLTLNQVLIDEDCVEVCLIPETLKRSNLSRLELNSKVTLEVDNFARGLIHYIEKQPHLIANSSHQIKEPLV